MADFLQQATWENERRKQIWQWIQARATNLRKSVTAYDVLRRNGITLRQSGSDREEQIKKDRPSFNY